MVQVSPPKPVFYPHDLVKVKMDPTVLCEVLNSETGDRLRIRVLTWIAGYSAVINVQDVIVGSQTVRDKRSELNYN